MVLFPFCRNDGLYRSAAAIHRRPAGRPDLPAGARQPSDSLRPTQTRGRRETAPRFRVLALPEPRVRGLVVTVEDTVHRTKRRRPGGGCPLTCTLWALRCGTDGGCLQPGSLVRGDSDGRAGAAAQDQAPPGGASPCRGGHRERRGDVPLLRDQPADVLQVAAPLRGARRGGPAGRSLEPPRPARTRPTPRSSARSSTCASTTTSARRKISMYLARYHDVTVSRSGVWRILKRLDMNRLPSSQRYKRHDRRWKRYEKQLPGHRVQVDVKFIEPLAGSAGRRKKPLPVHRHRRLHPDPGAADLRPQQPEDRHPVHRLRAGEAPVRRRGRPDRQRRRVPRRLPLAPARPRHRPRLHQAQDTHGSTARSSDPTASTPRSSTGSSTAGAPGRIRTSGLRIRRPTAVSAVLNLISPGRREAKRA